MDELTEKITQILNDPDGMDMVKSLAGSLLGGQNAPQVSEEKPTGGALSLPDSGGLSLDPKQLGMIMKVMNSLKSNDADDDRIRLLTALRPHLSPERQKKTDTAVKMLKLLKLLPLIRESGLFEMF